MSYDTEKNCKSKENTRVKYSGATGSMKGAFSLQKQANCFI